MISGLGVSGIFILTLAVLGVGVSVALAVVARR
jgi:hypothetical protein